MTISSLKFAGTGCLLLNFANFRGSRLTFEKNADPEKRIETIRNHVQNSRNLLEFEERREFLRALLPDPINHVCSLTLSTALKFSAKFFRKPCPSFFDQNQQPLNNVEPFEKILRALCIAQCPYKFSSVLNLRNGFSRFRLFACDFQLFRFFFSGSACFPNVPPPENCKVE